MKVYEFDAIIKGQELIDGAFIEFPYVVEEEFGIKGRVKVSVTFDGYEYRGSLVKMGHSCHIVGISQKIRKEINKTTGETVHVVLKKDDEPRIVEVPGDLQEELDKNTEAAQFFKELSYTNQKKFVAWITSAKKTETRVQRIVDAISMLRKKEVRP